MNPKEKAKELVNKFRNYVDSDIAGETSFVYSHERESEYSKKCALICIETEYHSNRELLFNLRACGVIESERVYLTRIQQLIDEENEVKTEIEKL